MKLNNGTILSVSKQVPNEITEEGYKELEFTEVGKVAGGIAKITNSAKYTPKPKPFIAINKSKLAEKIKGFINDDN